VSLVGQQARDAGDPRRLAAFFRPHAEREPGRVDAVANDRHIECGADALVQEAAVELGDTDHERGIRSLACEHCLVDEQVVGMRGEAVRRAREAVCDPRRERRIGREVGVDVLDPRALEAARVRGRERHRGERPHEDPRVARVAGDDRGHRGDRAQRPPHEPRRERQQPLAHPGALEALHPRLRVGMHDVVGRRREQRVQRDVELARDAVELPEHERLRGGREPRDQVGDPHGSLSLSRSRRPRRSRAGRSGSGRPSTIACGAAVTIHSSSARACGKASAA
jgi:hypothetical protein